MVVSPSAENGYDFLARVRTLCGIEIEVVSGETEAEIGVLGALGVNDGAVIDVGGASTELVVKNNGTEIMVYTRDGILLSHKKGGAGPL